MRDLGTDKPASSSINIHGRLEECVKGVAHVNATIASFLNRVRGEQTEGAIVGSNRLVDKQPTRTLEACVSELQDELRRLHNQLEELPRII